MRQSYIALLMAISLFVFSAAIAGANLLVILLTPHQVAWAVPGYIAGAGGLSLVYAVMKDGEAIKNYE